MMDQKQFLRFGDVRRLMLEIDISDEEHVVFEPLVNGYCAMSNVNRIVNEKMCHFYLSLRVPQRTARRLRHLPFPFKRACVERLMSKCVRPLALTIKKNPWNSNT